MCALPVSLENNVCPPCRSWIPCMPHPACLEYHVCPHCQSRKQRVPSLSIYFAASSKLDIVLTSLTLCGPESHNICFVLPFLLVSLLLYGPRCLVELRLPEYFMAMCVILWLHMFCGYLCYSMVTTCVVLRLPVLFFSTCMLFYGCLCCFVDTYYCMATCYYVTPCVLWLPIIIWHHVFYGYLLCGTMCFTAACVVMWHHMFYGYMCIYVAPCVLWLAYLVVAVRGGWGEDVFNAAKHPTIDGGRIHLNSVALLPTS